MILCHRCGNKFTPSHQAEKNQTHTENNVSAWQYSENTFATPPFVKSLASSAMNGFQPQGETVQDTNSVPDSELRIAPPQRSTVQLWPWLLVMLIATIFAGFLIQQDKWLDNRWFRSTLINLNLPVQQRDKDWLIVPESVQPEWVVRTDGSKVLLIRGKLRNLLSCELLVPEVEITLYAKHQPDQILDTLQLPITMQPDEHAIKQVPFIAPDADSMPVGPLSSRDFILLLQSLPDNVGDFTLSAKALQG
ncbi:hypothetical protein MMIC_P1734 [Mariprofundus micogutta]|uniref:DUF3426 domain-containing protein n=2 Tax=Mariprofundus micogutta TaxID=1921010 RepID=A0A1L8CPB1_9PROT|nr:hypothetical protein MMIC_P1734 [Mariprofundus micogutta]